MVMKRILFAALAAVIVHMFGWLEPWHDRAGRAFASTWRRVTDAWDLACFKFESTLKSALNLFGPTGVFAVRLQLLADAAMTQYRAWRGEQKSEHYRAPGGWVNCVST